MEPDGCRIRLFAALAAAFLILKAYYTLCEAVITELDDSRLASLAEKDYSYRWLNRMNEGPTKMLLAFTVNRTLCAAGAGFCAAVAAYQPMLSLIMRLIENETACAVLTALLLAPIIALLLLVLSDYLPKLLAERLGFGFAAFCVPSVRLMIFILTPLNAITSGCGRLLRKILKISKRRSELVTEEKILMLVEAGNETGVIEQNEKQMISNIFDFDDVSLSEVMTHRKDIVAVDVSSPIDEAVRLAMTEGFSRIPVYDGSLDRICGIVYAKDLLGIILDPKMKEKSLRSFMREVIYLPETSKCDDAFERLTQSHTHVAVVADEYGGTAGIVTMEDLLEEIVGNIQDEYDDEEEVEFGRISDGVFDVDGAADPEDIIPKLGGTLPEGHEYDTMSALYVDLLGRIPDVEEHPAVTYQNISLTPLLTEDNWISRIRAELVR